MLSAVPLGNTEVSVPVLAHIPFAGAGREAWQHLPGKGGGWAAGVGTEQLWAACVLHSAGHCASIIPDKLSNSLGERDGSPW